MSTMTVQAWQQDLANIVGESGILPDQERDQYVVDGKQPQLVVFPSTVEQVQELMRWAHKTQARIIPMGNGSKLGIGNPPQRVDVVVSTLKLNQVIEYVPANLTITVQPGIRLTQLRDVLADSGQLFPLDPPYQDLGTVGGTVVANASGPMRLKYGTARDVLIGIRAVQPDGTLIKGGGKVVKNVAGYDLNKLYVGSYGTLGIVVELTLKLQPLPAAFQLLLARFDSMAKAIEAGHEIVSSQLVPTIVTGATSLPSASIEQPCLAIGADGHPETVSWQMERFAASCEASGATQVEYCDSAPRDALYRILTTFPEARWVEPRLVCKASVPSDRLLGALEQVKELAQASNLHIDTMVHIGNGIIYIIIGIPQEEPEMASGVSITKQLREGIRALGGFLVLESAPPPIKRQVDTWGTVGNSFPLMRKTKDTLDPNMLLNPGRFVGGI